MLFISGETFYFHCLKRVAVMHLQVLFLKSIQLRDEIQIEIKYKEVQK